MHINYIFIVLLSCPAADSGAAHPPDGWNYIRYVRGKFMIISDFHVHSELSTDSEASFERQIKSAIDKGMRHLCFTEHMDFDFPVLPGSDLSAFDNVFQVDTIKYKSMFEKYRAVYSPSSTEAGSTESGFAGGAGDAAGKETINLYYGIELGLKTDITDKLEQFVRENEFDFIIGSIHLVDNIDVYEPEYFEGRTDAEGYRHYFETTLENIKKFNDFDVLGHLDYVTRKGKNRDAYSYADYADIIDEILKTLIQNGKGIEINTGSYKSGLDRPNPCADIIKRYKELGGEIITVGSDAHYPEYIANRFSDAELILRTAGFSSYCIFKNRKPSFIDLH